MTSLNKKENKSEIVLTQDPFMNVTTLLARIRQLESRVEYLEYKKFDLEIELKRWKETAKHALISS